MRDKRRRKRWHLIYYLRVFECGGNRLLGHVIDISPEGVMLISEEPIPTGQEIDLRMEIPGDDDGSSRNITMKARSVWSEQDVNRSFVDTGFELIEPSRETVHQIRALIERLHFDDIQSRRATAYL